MKVLKTGACLALFTVLAFSAAAQTTVPLNEPDYNKQKVFTDLPQRIALNTSNMEALLILAEGANVNTQIAQGLTLTGTVVSKSDPSDASVKSVVIKTNSRKNVVFSFSKVTKQDGTTSFVGRLLSREAGDALQITKEGTQYFLQKTGLYDLLSE